MLLEINNGTKKGTHWYDHVQVGMGGSTVPVNQNGNQSNAAAGSNIAVVFKGGVPSIKSAEVKEILAPVFDFDKHSATVDYVEQLPEPISEKARRRDERDREGSQRPDAA